MIELRSSSATIAIGSRPSSPRVALRVVVAGLVVVALLGATVPPSKPTSSSSSCPGCGKAKRADLYVCDACFNLMNGREV